MDQVEFIGLARTVDSKRILLASVFTHGKPRTEAKSLIERQFLKSASPTHQTAGYSTKVAVEAYDCYIIYDAALDCYLCAAAPHAFPERLAWDVLRAAQAEVGKVELDGTALHLNKTLRAPFRQLMNQTDELSNAQNAVETVKSKMTASMTQMTSNMRDVEELEARAADLEGGSDAYVMHSIRMKAAAEDTTRKWTVAMGLILLVTMLFFLHVVNAI